jgi:hypothetical protein
MAKAVVSLVVLTVGLAACVPAGTGAPGAAGGAGGAAPAGGQTAASLVSGRSVLGTYVDGTTYCEYHAASGQLLGSDRQGAYEGTWSAAANQLCYAYPARGVPFGCQDVSVQGQQVTFHDSGQAYAVGTVVGGNAC